MKTLALFVVLSTLAACGPSICELDGVYTVTMTLVKSQSVGACDGAPKSGTENITFSKGRAIYTVPGMTCDTSRSENTCSTRVLCRSAGGLYTDLDVVAYEVGSSVQLSGTATIGGNTTGCSKLVYDVTGHD